MRILLIEDDDTISEPLIAGLDRYGFAVEHVRTGGAALSASPSQMVLLDLGLPDMDGIDVCRRLRAASPALPIIMLTARAAEADRVVGLELGADDYLVKPFSLRELVARIRAVIRRMEAAAAAAVDSANGPPGETLAGRHQSMRVGELTVDPRTREVHLGGEPVALAPREFDLLALLAADPGAVRRREDIIAAVWDENFFGSTKTLDFHVAALRRKLGDPAWIQTVRGVGFRLARPQPAPAAR